MIYYYSLKQFKLNNILEFGWIPVIFFCYQNMIKEYDNLHRNLCFLEISVKKLRISENYMKQWKIVHKNVGQGCQKIRKSESKKAMQPLHKEKFNFHNISIGRNLYQNWLMNECARKNLAKLALCDLSWPLMSY